MENAIPNVVCKPVPFVCITEVAVNKGERYGEVEYRFVRISDTLIEKSDIHVLRECSCILHHIDQAVSDDMLNVPIQLVAVLAENIMPRYAFDEAGTVDFETLISVGQHYDMHPIPHLHALSGRRSWKCDIDHEFLAVTKPIASCGKDFMMKYVRHNGVHALEMVPVRRVHKSTTLMYWFDM